MSTDLFSTELWQDGQGITLDKMNSLSRGPGTLIADQVLASLIGGINLTAKDIEFGGQNGANAPTVFAYALQPGGAYLRQGSANHKIQIAPGTLLQKTGNATGSSPTLLSYTFAGTEEWTLTNGDATNPRVDLLQMKLEIVSADPATISFKDDTTRALTSVPLTNTHQRVQCTLSVKSGTPAASPQVPDPDAGYVAVGSVIVGNTWTTAGNAPIFGLDTSAAGNVVVHDQRMPLRVRSHWVPISTANMVTAWSYDAVTGAITSSNATNDARIMCPAGLGRIVGVLVEHEPPDNSSPTASPTIVMSPTAAAAAAPSSRATVTLVNSSPVGSNSFTAQSFIAIDGTPAPSAGPTIVQSAVNKIGAPVWTNGRRSPHEVVRLVGNGVAGNNVDRAVLRFQSGFNDTKIRAVVWYVAEGL